MTPLTEQLADFGVGLRRSDVPVGVAARWSDAIADCLGVGLAGVATEVAKRVATVVERIEGRPGGGRRDEPSCPLFGRAETAGPLGSALHNGTLCHALDYDDTLLSARSHASAHLLPVLVAIGDDASGSDALLAYGAGCEIEARIGLLFGMRERVPAWHATGVIGTIGAAATAARVMGLDVARTQAALAIAGSASSGLRANTGSMVKPLHAGYAARNGVLAAMLADAGVTGNANALDADGGFLDAFGGSSCDSDRVGDTMAGLGSSWESCGRYGLAIKLYPSCSLTHCAIEAALDLREGLDSSSVSSVTVDAGAPALEYLPYSRPADGLQAKFSMQFCVAAALRFGKVDVEVFEEFERAAAGLDGLLEKVRVRRDPALEKEADDAARVTVVGARGKASSREVLRAKGDGSRWPTEDELGEKFAGCVSRARLGVSASELFRAWRRIGDVGKMGAVIDWLRPNPVATAVRSGT